MKRILRFQRTGGKHNQCGDLYSNFDSGHLWLDRAQQVCSLLVSLPAEGTLEEEKSHTVCLGQATFTHQCRLRRLLCHRFQLELLP
jgi:hypothetical protein